jgi:hypothetical protein
VKTCRDRTRGGERGGALLGVLIVGVLTALLCVATLDVATTETKSASVARQRLVAAFVAEAGIEREIADLKDLQRKSILTAPFLGIDAQAGRTTFTNELLVKDGAAVGEYTVRVTAVSAVNSLTRDVSIESIGWAPSAASPGAVRARVNAVVRCALARSEVFDYVYFINNWGWYYGDTITANGNVRANGQFDCGRYAPVVNGLPRYRNLEGADLQGYIDDNHDGIKDGSDGGIYAGWDIVGSERVRGMAGERWTQDDADAGRCSQAQVDGFKNQHDFLSQMNMPNLTDLTIYENMAKAKGSRITIGGVQVCNAVVGDEAGEKQNLYLAGTDANPIVLNGLVVVRGDLIISGKVTGHGAIYCGRNVYVPKDLAYVNPPDPVPLDRPTEQQLETWLAANLGKDALGLFARNHIVCGDYTNSSWQSYVRSWVSDPRNKSEEDAGGDGIPNTRAGRDGILGTADDDTLDGDHVWTVQRYTQADADRGLLPLGKRVGDAIPGTGEDIDGDGVYDPTTQMSEFNVSTPLTSSYWQGNIPASVTAFSQISSLNLTRTDGAFYTNHTLAALSTAWNSDWHWNGCVVSRNEAIVYGTKTIKFNYDVRLYGGGESHGFYLPKVWAPIQLLLWQTD